ncbi:GNAT family N-acetyltransferase [Bhargavaea beijingensis]|uniref:N-acetyltransferase n=1 Tax=Bhargavaea beijingensis TaxID=426756 RepID=A0A1G7GWI6_9BACL|nr:GNAT family N-acetyltransferase [Bhargavaea beijingensis]MCW1927734.1 GNAT family N-acetyltransferase [Bhargavaea beijingensis]RSK33391.1 N-acetyltransferase [Bhargavaea beijingensis]SDE92423.1 ribosomal-protein-alanine N-acetyltransferase [Bhargavaea beijingensis]
MDIRLEPLRCEDSELLYAFETENREFFEASVPGRGDDYFFYEVFLQRFGGLLEEQDAGGSRFFLIKDEANRILGRMNLTDIDAESGTGELGYRIAQAHGGKGVASRALADLLHFAVSVGVRKILAKTTTTNIASCRVLEKNGFLHTGTDEETFVMNNEVMKFTYYEWNHE